MEISPGVVALYVVIYTHLAWHSLGGHVLCKSCEGGNQSRVLYSLINGLTDSH